MTLAGEQDEKMNHHDDANSWTTEEDMTLSDYYDEDDDDETVDPSSYSCNSSSNQCQVLYGQQRVPEKFPVQWMVQDANKQCPPSC